MMLRLASISLVSLAAGIAGATPSACPDLAAAAPDSLAGWTRTDAPMTEPPELTYDAPAPSALSVTFLDPGADGSTEERAERAFFASAQAIVKSVRDEGRSPAGPPEFHRIDAETNGFSTLYRMQLSSDLKGTPRLQHVMSLFSQGPCFVAVRLTEAAPDMKTTVAKSTLMAKTLSDALTNAP